jgi:hypothetical protein
MPIRIDNDLPVKKVLEQENIFVMDEHRAMTQDIRPLDILILNLMPLKEDTELQLLRSLSNTPLQVNISFIRTMSYESKHVSESHLERFYSDFEHVKNRKWDGLIITGAPVENMEFEEVEYWAVQENINAIRAASGLSPLAMDGGLSAAADARCESFVAGGAFDHSGMTTRSEICAAGPIGSASSVCSYWQNSPAHYANITNASFTSMGVACWFCSTAEGQYTYWTVTFN